MAAADSSENYLKEIYELSRGGRVVKTSRLAAVLGVSPAAVTEMVKRLEEQKLLSYRPYHGVRLTPKGKRRALTVLRRHRLWELFLFQVLKLPWSAVHDHAHRLEHATDDRLADALDRFLGNPAVDPHGAPIPSAEGELPEQMEDGGIPLTEVEPGSTVTILRCANEDAELLEHLGSLGLVPGTVVTLVEAAPFDGPLTLRVDGGSVQVGLKVARTLFV